MYFPHFEKSNYYFYFKSQNKGEICTMLYSISLFPNLGGHIVYVDGISNLVAPQIPS